MEVVDCIRRTLSKYGHAEEPSSNNDDIVRLVEGDLPDDTWVAVGEENDGHLLVMNEFSAEFLIKPDGTTDHTDPVFIAAMSSLAARLEIYLDEKSAEK